MFVIVMKEKLVIYITFTGSLLFMAHGFSMVKSDMNTILWDLLKVIPPTQLELAIQVSCTPSL